MILTEKVDTRTAADVAAEVNALFPLCVDGWTSGRRLEGPGQALVAVFSRYAAIVIDRLNRAPDKNLKVFLDLLGASPLPPQPARVPLTFFPAPGNREVVVPALTQVAATPEKNEKDPVLFETEREFVITTAKLDSVFVADPSADSFADYSTLSALTAPREKETAKGIFHGDTSVLHAFYIAGGDLFSHAGLAELEIQVALERDVSARPRRLEWSICIPGSTLPLTPVTDTTAGLTTNGSIVFSNLPAIPISAVDNRNGRWLYCRLAEAVSSSAPMPSIKNLVLRGEVNLPKLVPTQARANSQPLDLSKDFLPFGERPKFGDTLYLSHPAAFSAAGAVVTLGFTLSNEAAIPGGLPAVKADGVKLLWEFGNGAVWSQLGMADCAAETGAESTNFWDTTRAFTKTGKVRFRIPPLALPAPAVGGDSPAGIRVRIVSGNYGAEVRYDNKTLIPASFAPPCIRALEMGYSLTAEESPVEIRTVNNRLYVAPNPALGFQPFSLLNGPDACLYLGFNYEADPPVAPGSADAPSTPYAPSRSMSMYFMLEPPIVPAGEYRFGGAASLSWEFWNPKSSAWEKRNVIDETDGLRYSGIVRFLAPADFSATCEFGLTRCWLRIRRVQGEIAYEPRLLRVLLNTTMAAHTLTTDQEVMGASEALGVSNGTPAQTFKVSRFPVLEGPCLQVLEPVAAAPKGLAGLGGAPIRNPLTQREERWVSWDQATTFHGSGQFDRHYTLDHMTGLITFGDGQNGMIPPVGSKVRLVRFQTGGGAAGNRSVNNIAQLATTVPYVEKVANLTPATGGADAEEIGDFLDRAPSEVRHRMRAVTVEDYQDLAHLASPEVAKAECLPLVDLQADPEARSRRPGVVSLIVAPRSADLKPQPSGELLARVRRFLDEHRPPGIKLVVVGPWYLSVRAEVEVTLTSIDVASQVELALSRDLKAFLHPITGGPAGKGWTFGRLPHKSELFRWLEGVPGVSHVGSLGLVHDAITAQNRHFLISPEDPVIKLSLPD